MALNIKTAIKHPGAMTGAAKKAGMSNAAYAQKHKHDSGKAGQRARFALLLESFNKNRKKKSVIDAIAGKKK